MREGGRDRAKELVIPRVTAKREPQNCAFCGRPVGPSHEKTERYGQYRYCSSQCHKDARRVNATENAKKKVLRPLHSPGGAIRQGKRTERADATEVQRCWKCEKDLPVRDFASDRSRNNGCANICRPCEREKSRLYYEAKGDTLRERAKHANRKARSTPLLSVPAGVCLTPRQLKRATDNLTAIVNRVPVAASEALLRALGGGKVNGMLFEDKGGCGCLWGILGRAMSWGIAEEGDYARQFRGRTCAEVDLFGQIAPGDTPATNPYSAVCCETILAALRERENHPQ